MNEQLEKLIGELRATMGKLEVALGAISDAILWTDEKGGVQWCNSVFDRLVGRSHIEVLGKNLKAMPPLKQNGQVISWESGPIAKTLASKTNATDYYDFEKNEKKLILEITGAAIRTPNNTKTAVLVIRDVTAFKTAEKALIEKSAELERSNRELEQFAFVASHDLQEPLRVIQNFTELLGEHLSGELDEAAQKYMRYITNGAVRMRTLIQDLLAYSRAGMKDLNEMTVDFGTLVDEAVEGLQDTIKEANAVLVRGDLPKLKASPALMRQVFQNLIANAVKFRGEQAPKIAVSASQAESEWIFAVTDNGIGIEKRYHDKIFEIFQRLHPTSKYPGTGIGLAICKKIVERHGGRIWIESEPGKGTTFYFSLPAESS